MTLYMISPLQDRICSGLERRGPRPPFPDPLSRQRKAVLCGSGGPAESAHPVTDLGPEAQGGARHSSPPVLAGVGRFPGVAVVYGWINALGSLGALCMSAMFPPQ